MAVDESEVRRRVESFHAGPVSPDAPSSCGTGFPLVLGPTQLVPKALIAPGSPLHRLIVVQPPGSGKTCSMLEVLSNFKDDESYDIALVGDADVFMSIRQGLESCPNPGGGPCALHSDAKSEYLAGGAATCHDDDAPKLKARVYWMTYKLLAKYLAREHHCKSQRGNNLLVIMDEVHQLVAAGRRHHHDSSSYVAKRLSSAGDSIGSAQLYVVGYTATPILDDPVQVVRLATIMKGQTDPRIFAVPGGGELLVDPDLFYSDKYLTPMSAIKVSAPGNGSVLSSSERVSETLAANRCLPARSAAAPALYTLKSSAEAALRVLFRNLFFVTNNVEDRSKFPSVKTVTRLVEYSADFASAARETLAHRSKLRWQEVSNFARPALLKSYVKRRLGGAPHTPRDAEMFEALAPKWTALARDLKSRPELEGKTAVYIGASTGVSSVAYLLGLSFLLQHELGLANGLHVGDSPAVYVLADSRSGRSSIGSDAVRSEQLKRFNASPCVGDDGSSGRHSVLLLGPEAYKAVDLTCCTNICQMIIQPQGKALQTLGRARRQCSFARVPSKAQWRVNALTYVFKSPPPPCPGEDCDCLLGSFFAAQAVLSDELMRIVRGESIACKNFEGYNQWPPGTTCLS